ncbi:MAG: PQQ-dependent sugar dehydrogenase, partial [Myxococcota bacterium]
GFVPEWEGDFLVGGLADRSIHRLRIADGRVQYDEPIRIGERIRDISQGAGGVIYILTDANVLMELRPARPETRLKEARTETTSALHETLPGWSKAQVVLARCGVCHSYERNVESPIAPNLHGLVGRKKGGSGFANHTEEWAALEGVWTEEALEQLLKAPASFAPSSFMAGQSVGDEEARAAMIAYFKSLSD